MPPWRGRKLLLAYKTRLGCSSPLNASLLSRSDIIWCRWYHIINSVHVVTATPLQDLRAGRAAEMPQYDFATHKRVPGTRKVRRRLVARQRTRTRAALKRLGRRAGQACQVQVLMRPCGRLGSVSAALQPNPLTL
jgi:hypothetical protein